MNSVMRHDRPIRQFFMTLDAVDDIYGIFSELGGRSGRVVSASDRAVTISSWTTVFIATATALCSLGHGCHPLLQCLGQLSIASLRSQ